MTTRPTTSAAQTDLPVEQTRRPAGSAAEHIALDAAFGAQNYAPLDVVIERGEGAFVWDVDGERYWDFLSAYSALNQGHCHPRLVRVTQEQAAKLTLTSRAYYNDQLGELLRTLCVITGLDRALPMNSGAEAVETAIKAMRRYGYEHLGVPENRAVILVASENFHGRTSTIISFSTDASSFDSFGPYMPGFEVIPYGDAAAAAEHLARPEVVGMLVEPIQGEAGVIIPPADYLPALRKACTANDKLLCLDEIQTGFGRTGQLFCYCHTAVRPDLVILGKALSGGMLPVSAVVGRDEIMRVFAPGSHGSTFGGSPLAAAVATEAVQILFDEQLPQRSAELGAHMLDRLRTELAGREHVREVRGRGLLLAVEFHEPIAKAYVYALRDQRILAKDTHGTTIRFAPPLVIARDDLDAALDRIIPTLAEPRATT